MIDGGASLPPKRCEFEKLAMLLSRTGACSSTAFMVLIRKVRNWVLVFGVFPGDSRLVPLSVISDQLACLPDPLIPLNGFSWKRTRSLWRRAMRCIRVIRSRLWSTARLASSNIGAHSYWFGATSLWRVFNGMPSLYDSTSKSSIKALTRLGIEPK